MVSTPTKNRHWARWVIGGVVALVVVIVGGTFVYLHFIQGDPPPKLSLSTVTTPSDATGNTGSAASLAGTWKVGSGSTAGYRVGETVFGQSNTAVGRTDKVTGSMTIDGTTVTKATVIVDMTSVQSVGNTLDGAFADRRDGQFHGRIMNTDQFPTATFTLAKPIDFAPVPKVGVVKNYSATGKLTLHGSTKGVTIPLTAKRTGGVIAVQGITTVNFDDYGIGDAAGGPASSVDRSGQLEFLVQFQPS
jgi:polyisoprenoid-binding protein YceI